MHVVRCCSSANISILSGPDVLVFSWQLITVQPVTRENMRMLFILSEIPVQKPILFSYKFVGCLFICAWDQSLVGCFFNWMFSMQNNCRYKSLFFIIPASLGWFLMNHDVPSFQFARFFNEKKLFCYRFYWILCYE